MTVDSHRLATLPDVPFRQIADLIQQGVWVLDVHGLTTYVSPYLAELIGRSPADLLGRPPIEFSFIEDRHKAAEMIDGAREGRPVHGLSRAVKPDGTVLTLDITANPLIGADGTLIGSCAIIIDRTDLDHAHNEAAQALRLARTLSMADQVVVSTEGGQGLVSAICKVIALDGGYPAVWLAVPDVELPAGLRVAGSYGPATDFLHLSVAGSVPDKGPIHAAFDTRRTQVVEDVRRLPATLPWRRYALANGLYSLVAMPLGSDDTNDGVLVVHDRDAHTFDRETLSVMEQLARNLAFGLRSADVRADRAAYSERLERSLESSVRAIANAAEIRDPFTAGHQDRVAQLTRATAARLGLSPQEAKGIEMAAAIHDIGKLAVPADILTWPGKLGYHEFELIKKHARAGYEIVAGIDFPWPVPTMILQHHERLDGSGYPDGLRGEELLTGTRVLAVADTVEAMSSHRPYRPALGLAAGLQVIREGRDTLFDGAVVDACVGVFRDGFEFETHESRPVALSGRAAER